MKIEMNSTQLSQNVNKKQHMDEEVRVLKIISIVITKTDKNMSDQK